MSNCTVCMRVSEALKEEIEKQAAERGYLNSSDFLRFIIREKLEKEV